MQWAVALADDAQLDVALERASDEIWTQLDQHTPDLLLVFVSSHYPQPAVLLSTWLQQQFTDTLVLGCTAAGVLGSGRELEHQPAVVLLAACLPGVNLTPFQLDEADLPDPEAAAADWERLIGCPAQRQPQFILLADAGSFDPEPLLTGLDLSYPDSKKLGALVGGKTTTLYLDHGIYHSGLIGVALEGNLHLETIVAQGCRPIGQPLFVTAIEHNRILSLDGQPPPEALRAVYQTLPPADQALFRNHLLIGLALDQAMQYQQGDFLVRHLRGMESDTGALVINALPPRNSVVQFQVRDVRAAVEELEQLMAAASTESPPAGAVVFSCLGRGHDLYGEPNHDSRVFTRHFGAVPLGGAFAYGEIGPLHGLTFVHSFTSAFGLFRPKK